VVYAVAGRDRYLNLQGANRAPSSRAWARRTVAVLGLGDPNSTHALTYDPARHVDAIHSDTRAPVVLPSKFGWIALGLMRKGRTRCTQFGADGSHERVTWTMIPSCGSAAIVR
jgi:hypothetical protein